MLRLTDINSGFHCLNSRGQSPTAETNISRASQKIFLYFMEPECTRQPATCPYPISDEFRQGLLILFFPISCPCQKKKKLTKSAIQIYATVKGVFWSIRWTFLPLYYCKSKCVLSRSESLQRALLMKAIPLSKVLKNKLIYCATI